MTDHLSSKELLALSVENTARWLENGCDPKQAANELRIIARKMTAVEPETAQRAYIIPIESNFEAASIAAVLRAQAIPFSEYLRSGGKCAAPWLHADGCTCTAEPPNAANRNAQRLKDYFDNANCIAHPSLFYSAADPFGAWCESIDEYVQELASVTKDSVRVGTLGHVSTDKSSVGAALQVLERSAGETSAVCTTCLGREFVLEDADDIIGKPCPDCML